MRSRIVTERRVADMAGAGDAAGAAALDVGAARAIAPLAGRRALVCGASQGIGRACAEQLARLGARVTVCARDEAALRALCDALPPPVAAQDGSTYGASAGAHEVLRADFHDRPGTETIVRQHIELTGPIEILFNNTGGPPPGPAFAAHAEEFVAAFASHLLCNHLLAQLLVPGMKERQYGRIINLISTSVKQPIAGLGVSNTVRGAVASWAKTLATELAPFGITVNNVLPGATKTGRLTAFVAAKARAAGRSVEEIERAMLAEIPAGRFAEPHEIAAAVGFLASPAAAYITGINVPVDGGRTGCL
jgi:3-oxoacyl-[acyl-carrier protein] reductase